MSIDNLYWSEDKITLYKKLMIFASDKNASWHGYSISLVGLDGFSYRSFDTLVALQKSGAIDLRNIKCTYLLLNGKGKRANIPLARLVKLRNTIKRQLEIYPTYFELVVNPVGRKTVRKELGQYVNNYLESKLIDNHQRFLRYSNTKSVVLRSLGAVAKVYGPKNLNFSKTDMWSWVINQQEKTGYLNQTKFWEAVLSMEKEGFFEVVDVINSTSLRLNIKSAPEIPQLNEWNTDFYNIASSISFFDYLKKRKKIISSGAKLLEWNGLTLNTENGMASLDGVEHRFKTSKPHFKILKELMEANGKEVTYEKFFMVVAITANDNQKEGKDFVRQKIRDMRKFFHINRSKDRGKDIFFDTGNGFKLQRLEIAPEEITK